MGYIDIILTRDGETPTAQVERIGESPIAQLDMIGSTPLVSMSKINEPIILELANIGGEITVNGAVTPTVGNDTLTISETSLSFTNAEVGTMKYITVLATAPWSVELIDPDGLFEIHPTSGPSGFVGRVAITLIASNPNVERYSASAVFKSRGLRQTLTLVAEASAATYTPLTYIEATGAQYINLGYVVQEDDVIEMDFIGTYKSEADKFLFGAYADTGLWVSLYGSDAYVRRGTNSPTKVSGAYATYHVRLETGKVIFGNTTTSVVEGILPNVPLYLFANNSKNGVYGNGYCRCLRFKISNANGVVMELLPHKRNADGKIGMLDSVSGNFFGNGGTGEDFIAGAEIKATPEYELIEYVTFSKDKLYDLGIVKSTYTLEVMFKRSESTTTPYLYGIVTSPHTASVTAYLSSSGAWRFGSSYKGLSTNNTNTNYTIIKNGNVDFNFTSGSFTKSTFTTPNTVVLGGYRAASGSLTKNYQGRVYFIRINEGDTPIIDYYPCKRISDGVEGFWDCVSQTFIESI